MKGQHRSPVSQQVLSFALSPPWDSHSESRKNVLPKPEVSAPVLALPDLEGCSCRCLCVSTFPSASASSFVSCGKCHLPTSKDPWRNEFTYRKHTTPSRCSIHDYSILLLTWCPVLRRPPENHLNTPYLSSQPSLKYGVSDPSALPPPP